jgi:NADPH-dependent 7-cyano-7-deazaguanine reductase QueF
MSELERFESKHGLICTFKTDELTALCPFDFGGPDMYELTIRYETHDYTVESKSLKQWLQNYRDVEISAEDLAHEIHREVTDCIAPTSCYVCLEQARRGGIEETVEVGNVHLR